MNNEAPIGFVIFAGVFCGCAVGMFGMGALFIWKETWTKVGTWLWRLLPSWPAPTGRRAAERSVKTWIAKIDHYIARATANGEAHVNSDNIPRSIIIVVGNHYKSRGYLVEADTARPRLDIQW